MRTAHKLLLVLTSLILVACRKDPKVFFEDWQLAVAHKDAPAVWALLSTDSRERVVRAIERSQAKAKSDPQFAVVLGNVSRRMVKKNGLTTDPEELAIAYVKHQLELDYGGARIGNAKVAGTDVTGDTAEVKATIPAPNGKTIEGKATVKWDQKKWRVVVDVVGLQTQEGDAFAPWILFPYYEGYEARTETKPSEGTLTVVREMRLKGGGDPAKLSAEERAKAIAEKRLTPVEGAPPLGYEVHVKPDNKKSNDDLQEEVVRAAYQITSAQFEPNDIKRGAYQDQLGNVLASYVAVQGTIFPNTAFGNVLDVSFSVDRGGSVGIKLAGFNNKTTRNESVDLPKLVFAPFPRS